MLEKVPIPHLTQLASLFDPVLLLNLPAAQDRQVEGEEAPRVEDHLPAPQSRHTPGEAEFGVMENVPWGHMVHAELPEAELNLPGTQGKQNLFKESPPDLAFAVPAGQGWQEAEPETLV